MNSFFGRRLLAAVMIVGVTSFASGAGAAVMSLAPGAGAATLVDFDGGKADPYIEDGFAFDPVRIVNGNCLSGSCAALNDNETMVMTSLAPSPGSAFTLDSLNFNLLGNGTGNTLTVTGSNAAVVSFSVPDFAKNTYHLFDFGDIFADVTSVAFSASEGGNVRIDNLTATPVPLPAAAWLLLGGMGVLGAASRRRRTA